MSTQKITSRNIAARIFSGGVGNVDPNFSSVSLLLFGEGSNGANNLTFNDSSPNNLSVSVVGTPGQGSFSPFPPSAGVSEYFTSRNGGSIYFNGSTDYLVPPTSAVFAFGTGDFTVEMWLRPSASGTYGVFATGSGSTTNPYIYINGTTPTLFYNGTGVATGPALTVGAWNHVAVVRNATTYKVFTNGVAGTPVTLADSLTAAGAIVVGASSAATQLFAGHMSDFRVVKGTALYSSNFSVPTAPLGAVTNTQLLLSATNAAIYDSAAKNDLVTRGNTASMVAISKFGGSSIYFDGAGDYLSVPSSASLGLGTGDFTVEMWVYPTRNSGNEVFIDLRTSDTAMAFNIGKDAAGAVRTYDGTTIRTGGTMGLNAWHHVAWVRIGSTNTIYLNGSSVSTFTNAFDAGAARPATIGSNVLTSAENYQGYIDNLRITKGVGRYPAGFTPSAETFPSK